MFIAKEKVVKRKKEIYNPKIFLWIE